MIPHSLSREDKLLDEGIASGLYSDDFDFVRRSIGFDEDDSKRQILVQSYARPDKLVKVGGRVLSAFTNYSIISNDGQLMSETQRLVESLVGKLGLN